VINSGSPLHPFSSQSEVMPKGVPTAMTDGPVSPLTPISVIEVGEDGDNNYKVIEIFGDDDDNDGDEPARKASTPSDGRVIVSFDGNPIPAIQVATDDSQNLCVKGDLDVQLPCHLYDAQRDANPAASNSGSSHVSGAMVPGSSVDRSTSKCSHSSDDGSISSKSVHSPFGASSSSISLHSAVDGSSSSISLYSVVDGSSSSISLHSVVDGSSSSISLHSVVDGSSSYTSVCSSPADINHRPPSVMGTAGGNLPKCYITSQIAEGGCAFPAQVPTVAQEMNDKVSCFFFLSLCLSLLRTFVELWIVDLKLCPNKQWVTGRSPGFNILNTS
jgi:hypothetical protein